MIITGLPKIIIMKVGKILEDIKEIQRVLNRQSSERIDSFTIRPAMLGTTGYFCERTIWCIRQSDYGSGNN